MSTIEDAFYHHAKDASAVAALVGTRIYRAGNVPQGTTANYIVYQRVSTPDRVRHQTGVDGLAQTRISATCWAATSKVAKQVSDALRGAFETVQNEDIGETGSEVAVKCATPADERHYPLPPTDGSQRGMHGYVLDLLIWHEE